MMLEPPHQQNPSMACGACSIEWCLRVPLQPSKIRVFAILSRAVSLVGLALCAARFLVPLLLLTGFLAVSLRGCRFAWSSDDALLSSAVCLGSVYDDAAPRLRVGADFLDAGLTCPSFWCERETVSGLSP